MRPRFLQFHTLTSYPAALLNRDDAGFAKRLPFGGATRTRISSQCLKRHWRTFEGEHAVSAIQLDGSPVPMAVRSRRTFESYVLEPLLASGVSPEIAAEATRCLMTLLLGESAKAKAARSKEGDEAEAPKTKAKDATPGRTGQITVLGRPEIDYLYSEAASACAAASSAKEVARILEERFKREAEKNLRNLRHAAGLDAALFGRMVTSDFLARGDAALHVAHAFTVHAEMAETDYFSAVDDLLAQGDDRELGSGHIGTTELASGLYYGYVVVDLPLLVSNLEGCKRGDWEAADPTLAAEVVSRLVHLVATVSPGAKLGSTAPYSYAHLVLVEAGSTQPRSLANAFLAPVREQPDLLANAYGALATHLSDLDDVYGRRGERKAAALGPRQVLDAVVPPADRSTLAALAAWARAQVGG